MDQKIKQRNAELLQRLNPGKDVNSLVKQYYKQKYKLVIFVVILAILLSLLLFLKDIFNRKISVDGEIPRSTYGENNQSVELIAQTDRYPEMAVTIPIASRKYNASEIQTGFAEAKEWLDEVMLGENASLQEVKSDLLFPGEYESRNIAISYMSSDYNLVDSKGNVHNEDLKDYQEVCISVEFSYENSVDKVDYNITVCPLDLSEEQAFVKELRETLINSDKEQCETEIFILPKEVNGIFVQFREKINSRFLYVLLLGIVGACLIYFGMDNDLKKKYQTRRDELLMEYPEFVSKLALLIGAGMSLSRAIMKVYVDNKEKDSPLTEELSILVHNFENGISEDQAIEDFGKRTGLPEYRKFCSVISVNLKKGSINLKAMLEQEAETAFEQQQAFIRKLGEEAGTKLLLPMVMMLAVVIAIIMVPAFLTYQIS